MKKGLPIDWVEELDTFRKKFGMNSIMETAKMLAGRMEPQTFLDDKLRDRKNLGANIQKAVQGTRFERQPKGPWNGLVLFTKMAIFALDNYSCVYCGTPASSFDHLVPKSRGKEDPRLDRVTNLVSSCRACNTDKARLNTKDFAKKIGDTEKPRRLMEQAKHWTEQPEYASMLRRRAEGLTRFLDVEYEIFQEMENALIGTPALKVE